MNPQVLSTVHKRVTTIREINGGRLSSPSSQACGGISRTCKQYFSLGFAGTQTAPGGFGTVRLNETTLPGHALLLGKSGQFESSKGDELAGTNGPWSTPQGHS